MPVYSVLCKDLECQTQFDIIGSWKDPLPTCPECGAPTMRVITSAPSVSLKGSGWSADGYSLTDRGSQAMSDKADKKDRVVSFPGQLHKGRTGA